MKTKRILSLMLTMLMVLSVCPVFVVSADYLSSQEAGGNTVYNYFVSYDADEQKAVVEIYVKNEVQDIQTSGFGFEIVDGYSISDFALNAELVETAFSQELAITDNSVIGAWMAKEGKDSVKTSTDDVLIASFVVEMTPNQYKALGDDFITEAFPEESIAYIYDADAGNYLYIPDGTDTGIVTYPIGEIALAIDKTVDVTVEGIDQEITTADIAEDADMLENFTFEVENKVEGAYVVVNYKVGENGTPVEIEAVEGVYTIPGEDVIDDITITFTYGTYIESIALTGLEAPEAKATPDTDVVAEENANYIVSEVTWEPEDEAFDYNKTYKASVVITANDEHYVNSNTVVTIDDEQAEVKYLDLGQIKATVEFTTEDRKTAGNLEVTVEAPVATATPKDATVKLPEGETETPFNIVRTEWKDAESNPVDGAFYFETVYSATITVALEDTHKLPENFTITLGDKTFTAQDYTVNDDGTITFTVTFDATGSNKSEISGSITLVRAAKDAPETYATITFKDADGNPVGDPYVIETEASRADENGVVEISAITLDFAPGTYTAVISKNGYLDYTVTDIVIAQMVSQNEYTKLAFEAELVPGEIVRDGEVTMDDIMEAAPGEDLDDADRAAIDIDEDGVYTIFDFGYILNNFGNKAEDFKSAASPAE